MGLYLKPSFLAAWPTLLALVIASPQYSSYNWQDGPGRSSAWAPQTGPFTGPCASSAYTGSHPYIPSYTTSSVNPVTTTASSKSRVSETSTVTSATSVVKCINVQHNFPDGTNSNTDRANAVKAAYERSWNQYAQYCFGQDQVVVTNDTCTNKLFGWGASIVDGVDTAIIMGLTDIVNAQLTHIAATDFTKVIPPNGVGQQVDGFDAIIRYLGGLLSAYDLLTSGFVPEGTYDYGLITALLRQAVVIGEHLKPQFSTISGLPAGFVDFATGMINNTMYKDPLNNVTYPDANAAVSGTIILEFYRLSDLTGDQSYRQLADKAEAYLVNPNPPPAYPYLVGSELDVNTGNFLTFDFGWKAGIDSFLEYLIKTYIYNPRNGLVSSQYVPFWVGAVQSSLANIAESPAGYPQLTYLTQGDPSGAKEHVQDDYACFAGGNILYGSTYLDLEGVINKDSSTAYSQLGLDVTSSCHYLYTTTVAGLGPEQWGWFNEPGKNTFNQTWTENATYQASVKQRGYFILNTEYDSFPESIESIWYAYRITGDQMYQDWNWAIFNSLTAESNLAAGVQYSSISNVDKPKSFMGDLPSFYFAEVLKYMYLSFVPPNVISLNDWVFNTEAHPFLRQDGCPHNVTRE